MAKSNDVLKILRIPAAGRDKEDISAF